MPTEPPSSPPPPPPTPPLTPSSLFATLTPANTLAKLAFSNVFECHFRDQAAARRAGIHVAAEQTYDADVMRFRRRLQHQHHQHNHRRSLPLPPPEPPPQMPGYGSGGGGGGGGSFLSVSSSSDTDTDLDLDPTPATRALGLVWTGFYGFDFDTPSVPTSPQFGWTVGKGRPPPAATAGAAGANPTAAGLTDFLLATRRFARDSAVAMHGIHARFNFHPESSIFFVAKANRAADAEVTLEGSAVSSAPAVLAKSQMAVRIGSLEYGFEYAPFSRTQSFSRRRALYLHQFNAAAAAALTSGAYIPPTPLPGTRTFAGFTIVEPLGKGAFGKVWSGCDVHGRVVAIKIQEVTRRNMDSVGAEIEVLRRLTELADSAPAGSGYLLRLAQVLRASGDTAAPLAAPFEDIGLVMEPVAPMTLSGLELSPLRVGMPAAAAAILRGVLEAVNFLHSHGWIHRDLKKDNIGLVGNPARPILLDLGGACQLATAASKVPATPGSGGTVGYLAPERELVAYDAGVDVWAVGVIGFELARGRHPWRFAVNPWRDGEQFEKWRPRWESKYRESMDELGLCERVATVEGPRSEVVYVESLLREMLRYPWASTTPRITMSAALEHPAWRTLSEDHHQTKRTRI